MQERPNKAKAEILVVDDDARNQLAIRAVLDQLELTQTFASSGDEALRYLLDHDDVAAILLDVHMPKLDGFETAELIRRRERTKHIPILFITAYRHDQDHDYVRRGYSLGAVDYLFKPIVPEILCAKVKVLVDLCLRTAEVEAQAQHVRMLERTAHLRQLEEERRKWEAQSLRQQMDEQRRVNTRLAELDARKDDFLALLAHELRNPLAPVVTNLELIRMRGTDDPVLRRASEVMERQVKHLTRLVDDLLDIARISRHKLELRKEILRISDVVEHAIDACRPNIDPLGHELVVEPPDEPIYIEMDPVRMTQVLSNLLNNAARYSDPGGEIHVRWGVDDGQAVLSVSDRGRGIAPEFIERIFDMFVQERHAGGGLGLGLTLVRQLVELHGGTVAVTSGGVNQGSDFIVRLPIANVRPDAPRLPLVQNGQSTTSRLRIAVVDDDPDIRDGLRGLLEAWGHEVFEAGTGIGAVQLLLETPLDVGLLDIGLPDLDGYEAARRICDALGEERPRLIAMTGFGQRSDRVQSQRAGFDLHLVKPSDPEELRCAIEGRLQSDPTGSHDARDMTFAYGQKP